MASFVVDGVEVPALLYVSGSELIYLLAKDSSGDSWNDPVVLSTVFNANYNVSLLVNKDNTPAFAYRSDVNIIYFLQGTDPTFSTIAHSSNYAPGASPGWNAVTLIFTLNNQPIIFYGNSFNVVNWVSSTDQGDTLAIGGNAATVIGDIAIRIGASIVNGRPAIAYTVTNNSNLLYNRADDVDGTSWTGPNTTVFTPVFAFFTPVLFSFTVANVVYPFILLRGLLFQGADIDGTAWLPSPMIQQFGGEGDMMVDGSNLLFAYIDVFDRLRYMVLTESTLSEFESNDFAIVLEQDSLFTRVNVAVVNGGIAYKLEGTLSVTSSSDLIYYRPLTGTIPVIPSFTIEYKAFGYQ
jgi:hypothetical protein